MTAQRLRKKCQDCGKRGNWPKTIIIDTCEDCTRTRLHHDAIRKQAFDACAKREDGGKRTCHPTRPPMCESCTKYFAGETHAFWLRMR